MRFGGAEVPLRVDSFNDSLLNIGPLSLCKQIVDLSDFLPQTKPKLRGNWAAKPASYLPLVSRDIEFTPTANTQFKKGEKLYTYFEVYEPLLAGETSATVQFQMRFVDAKTGKSVSALESIIATSYVKQGNPVIPIGRGIDISKLPQGSYHLDIRAGDSAGKMTDWRSVNFSVE